MSAKVCERKQQERKQAPDWVIMMWVVLVGVGGGMEESTAHPHSLRVGVGLLFALGDVPVVQDSAVAQTLLDLRQCLYFILYASCFMLYTSQNPS